MTLFEDIPDDPELAFLELEKRFRESRAKELDHRDYNYDPAEEDLRYISRTLAACKELGLKILENWSVPSASDHDSTLFRNFLSEVDHYRTIFEIRHSRRDRGLTVRFDTAAKSKLRHYVTQIREFIDKLELDDWKRDDLQRAVSALETEIDRDRSRLGVVGDFMIKAAGILGDSAEKAEPVRKWIDSIARLIWGAEMKERTETLPRPPERREIPPPPRQISGPPRRKKIDDEIPF